MKDLKQRKNEKNKEFISRFNNVESKMRNLDINLPKIWLAAELLNRLDIKDIEKHNIISSIDDTSERILEDLKKKLKDLDHCKSDEAVESTSKTFFVNSNDKKRSHSRDGYSDSSRSEGRHRSIREYTNNYSGNHRRSRSNGSLGGRRSRSNSRNRHYNRENREKMTYHVRNEYEHPTKSIFDRQVQNKALIDLGCPDLVAGYPWMETYESTKNELFPS